MFNFPPRSKVRRSRISLQDEEINSVEIDCEKGQQLVAFLGDENSVACGGYEGKIQCWRVTDGKEVGKPIDVGPGRGIRGIAVSPNARWIASGATHSLVSVWDPQSGKKVIELDGHSDWVYAVDVDLDGTRIATGSNDCTARVWSLESGKELFRWLHDYFLAAVKFSPDGRHIATATWITNSIRIYNNHTGNLLFDIPIKVNSPNNYSLAWSSNGQQLFTLSKAGNIICLDASKGIILSQWPIHPHHLSDPKCIALASNEKFIATSDGSSVSFWDTKTHQQVGPTVKFPTGVSSMAISTHFDLAVGGDKTVTFCSLRDFLPSHYLVVISAAAMQDVRAEIADLEGNVVSLQRKLACREDTIQKLRDELATLNNELVESRSVAKALDEKNADSTARNAHLAAQLADSQCRAENLAQTVRAYKRKHECEDLYAEGCIMEASTALLETLNALNEDTMTDTLMMDWISNFRGRFVKKLSKLGDSAMDVHDYDEAIKYYSAILELDPDKPAQFLLLRSEAQMALGLLEDALIDADKAIEVDPSSHKGYERKYVVLNGMKRFGEAFRAFKMMLSILEQLPDPSIREHYRHIVDPTPAIQSTISESILHMPRVLIDTTTGHLCTEAQLRQAFEQFLDYDELRCSMVARLNDGRIREKVQQFYRYVMFSHRWEDGEPLFQDVKHAESVYGLEATPSNTKLQTFCKLARSLGFRWAWSDTCCIDRNDHRVLEASLVAMFRWYHRSSLTIVYLYDVLSKLQQLGSLSGSIWNTRAWTYQEYIASKAIQFYTKDWEPYLGLDIFNHKESSEVISEMEQVSQVSAKSLAVLQPGMDDIRKKLFLASMRKTTYVEDIAYSLLGIFKAPIPVMYGEGYRAVGRLLEHVLAGSGDVTILAWTGYAGNYNSCLPPDLKVYNQLVPPHVPQLIETAEMHAMVTALRSHMLDLSPAGSLYDLLHGLPSASFSESRVRLPGMVFPITGLANVLESESDPNVRVYRATTAALGNVQIKTTESLSRMNDLLLINPWISSLLDQEHGVAQADMRALRLVVRLRQPFGALLLVPASRTQYRRVAADYLIMAQVHEDVTLDELRNSVRTTITIQ